MITLNEDDIKSIINADKKETDHFLLYLAYIQKKEYSEEVESLIQRIKKGVEDLNYGDYNI